MQPVEPRVYLGAIDADLRDGPLERTQPKTLFALLLANQTYFVEQTATLLGDKFETYFRITDRYFYGPGTDPSQSGPGWT